MQRLMRPAQCSECCHQDSQGSGHCLRRGFIVRIQYGMQDLDVGLSPLEEIRTYLKKRILVQGVGGVGFQTGGILKYVEDFKPGTNTQIGPKDFFEIGSK